MNRRRTVNDSVGLASYAMDSHFCQRVVVEEDGKTTVRNEGGFGHGCRGPYPVSYRSIVPKREECANLLVPVCLSASHVAYGSIRMEPVFMILGQSAGTAAAMAIDDGVAVQDVSYDKLRRRLLEDGQLLKYDVPAASPDAVAAAGWELAWSDEFESDKLNDTKWSRCERGKPDWKNTMSDDPRLLKIEDGVLHLRGIVNDKKDRDPAPVSDGRHYEQGEVCFPIRQGADSGTLQERPGRLAGALDAGSREGLACQW